MFNIWVFALSFLTILAVSYLVHTYLYGTPDPADAIEFEELCSYCFPLLSERGDDDE